MLLYEPRFAYEYNKTRRYLWYLVNIEKHRGSNLFNFICDIQTPFDKSIIELFCAKFSDFFPVKCSNFIGIRAVLIMQKPDMNRKQLLRASKIIEKIIEIAQICGRLNNELFARG